jgi:hypothetical protein
MIVITATILIEAAIHWYFIERLKKDPKDNDALMILRTLFYVGVASWFAGVAYVWTLDYIFKSLLWVAIVVTMRWALFDYALNIMRGKPLFYLGNETIDDKIEKLLNGWLLLTFKALVFIGCSLLIYSLL